MLVLSEQPETERAAAPPVDPYDGVSELPQPVLPPGEQR
jgi:hypothetical protein